MTTVKGKAKVDYLGRSGLISHPDVPENGFLYEVSSLAQEGRAVGDRIVLGDGRVFRYAKAAGHCSTGFGAKCTSVFKPLTLAASPAIGDTKVVVTGTAELGTVETNELRGGLIVLHTDAGDKTHNGTIIGNSAGGNGDLITLFLDRPIVQRSFLSSGAAAGYVEIMRNPYSEMVGFPDAADTFASHLGVPAAYATSGQFFWLQTWGPVWLTPGGGSPSGVGITANGREVVFVGDGSINSSKDAVIEDGYQRAGFIIQKDPSTPAGGGPPFVMLQISP